VRTRSPARTLVACTRGASLVEYIIAIGAIALVAVAGFRMFGTRAYSKIRTAGDDVENLTPMKAGSDYCFAAGTLVATPAGLRAIEQIREGDAVLSRDDEASETTVVSRVTATFVTRDAPLVELRIREQSEPIRATPGHRFFTHDRGWVEAGALAAGEELRSAGAGAAHVEAVTRVDAHDTVYNFEVERTHTYFVGSASAWVHNPTVDCNGAPIDESQPPRNNRPGKNNKSGKDPIPPVPPPGSNIVPYPYRPQSGASMLTQPFLEKHMNPGDGSAYAAQRFNTPNEFGKYSISTSTNISKYQQNKFSTEVGQNSKDGIYTQAFTQAAAKCASQGQRADNLEFRTNQSYKTNTYHRQGGKPPATPYTAGPAEPNDGPFYYSMTYDPTTQNYTVNHFAGNAAVNQAGDGFDPPAGGPYETSNVNGMPVYFKCVN
jgi:hypothetical protein